MTQIIPCWHCPLREGCELRAQMRRKVKGLHLRRASFDCERLAAELRPGRRILITRPDEMGGWVSGDHTPRIPIKATITAIGITGCTADYKFRCVVDPGETDDQYRWRQPMHHYQITRFLDEPDKQICACSYVIHENDEGRCADRGRVDEHRQPRQCVDALGPHAASLAAALGTSLCTDMDMPF